MTFDFAFLMQPIEMNSSFNLSFVVVKVLNEAVSEKGNSIAEVLVQDSCGRGLTVSVCGAMADSEVNMCLCLTELLVSTDCT